MAAIPQIEGLTVDDFVKYARQKPSVLKYLPDEKKWQHLDKKWLCDILFTVDTAGISDMVSKAMQQRKAKLEKS